MTGEVKAWARSAADRYPGVGQGEQRNDQIAGPGVEQLAATTSPIKASPARAGQVDVAAVGQRDDHDGDVVDDREGQQIGAHPIWRLGAHQREQPERERRVGGHGRPPAARRRPARTERGDVRAPSRLGRLRGFMRRQG